MAERTTAEERSHRQDARKAKNAEEETTAARSVGAGEMSGTKTGVRGNNARGEGLLTSGYASPPAIALSPAAAPLADSSTATLSAPTIARSSVSSGSQHFVRIGNAIS